MATVRINTSDTGWIKRHAVPESEVIPHGTDIRGVMYFQVEVKVAEVEHVKFDGASMIRFDLGADWPSDCTRTAMYPESYLVHTCGRHCGAAYHPDAMTVRLIEQHEADHPTRR